MSHSRSWPLRALPRRLVVLSAFAAMLATAGLVQAPAFAVQAPPGVNGNEFRPYQPDEEDAGINAHKHKKPSQAPAAHVPSATGLPVSADPTAKRIEGLTLKDQRDANNGNSFSLEPPDQGLCVGTDRVIESVNNVFSIYSKTGAVLSGPQSYDPFWNDGTAEIVRHDDGTATYGPFVSDPKCYFDPDLNRFFMTELELGTDPDTGAFDGTSFVDVAVSRSATPTTSSTDWYLYQLDVANAGGPDTTTGGGGSLATHTGCPCLGDQPLIGADRYGFYVTTNEFPIATAGFNGAQSYAFDKVSLTQGTLRVQRIEQENPPLAEGVAYSVQPATSPVAGEWSSEANGTEFALSALEFTGGFDNRIATWAFTNTSSLAPGSQPAVVLSKKVIDSEVYGFPPKVEQRKGSYPLGMSLRERENYLDSNDDRMNQVVYSGDKLWSGLNTVIKPSNGTTQTGIAYFVVEPSATPAGVGATMANQGYVAVNRNNVIYPSIGVAAGGANATMVFTLSGRDYYPSTGYVRLSPAGSLVGGVQVYGAGAQPADGFTGYRAYGGTGVERWGDYSAAVADAIGTVWVAGEYIPGTFGYPPYLANWGTAIGALP